MRRVLARAGDVRALGHSHRRASRRIVREVITVVRSARVLLVLVLAFLTISSVIGVATPDTGALEKMVLLCLIGGCFYAAAKLTVLTDWAVERLARH
jgi:hypothetical protein